jgi:hypothetical protein
MALTPQYLKQLAEAIGWVAFYGSLSVLTCFRILTIWVSV